ncbi:MAG: hypothetical protein LC792_12850 [Actinobacteria bacterium]|nr:hypothetical protein [Actinomycetota bacterium]
MRNLPRFALVPLAALLSALPLVALPTAAGADTASDCEAAFTTAPDSQLAYTTDPPERLAWVGQTVHLSAAWDPSAWDSLTSAVACVRLDDTVDDALGTVQTAPANGGAFDHAFAIPDVEPGAVLCTRMRLAGDPAGEATEGVWVSKTHCFEVDHEVAEETPPDDTTPPETEQPSTTTTTTAPVASPAISQGTPGDTPAVDTPANPPASPEGGASPVETPFDSAAGPGTSPAPAGPTTPEALAELPATGYASLRLLHQGEALFFMGLGLLVLAGRRRRRTTA